MTKKIKNRQLAKFYDKVYRKGERTHHTEFLFGSHKLPPDETAALSALSWKNKTVLDVGCGTGLMAFEVARRGAKKVVGIDYSKDGIEVAKQTYRHKNVEYRCEDVKNHRGRYDIVISLGTLEHIDKPISTLKRMKKMLNPRGVLVLTSPNWLNPRGYILQTLYQLFDAPITLADIHYLTPVEYGQFAKQLDMKFAWSTFDFNWAHGPKLIKDFTRRLPNVFRDMGMTKKRPGIKRFIRWIETHVLPFDHTELWSGATGLYIFTKK